MNDHRWAISGLLITFLLGWSLATLLAIAKPPPVRLVDVSFEQFEVCPGDTIPYSVTWDIVRPAVLEITIGHLRAGADFAIPDGEKVFLPFWRPGLIVDNDAIFEVPNLPPGDYERSLGVESEDRSSAFMVIPYTIRDDCFD